VRDGTADDAAVSGADCISVRRDGPTGACTTAMAAGVASVALEAEAGYDIAFHEASQPAQAHVFSWHWCQATSCIFWV
jgi:hypothetical protein